MFRGQFEHSIDDKGRVSLPASYRKILKDKYDETLIITALDGCLLAYPYEEWLEVEDKIRRLPSGNRKVRDFKRGFVSAATECSIDRQGRILLSPNLKKYAQLEKNVVFAGLINHFEIWNKERLGSIVDKAQDYVSSDDFSEIIEDLGL